MKNDELGSGLKKIIRQTVRDEFALLKTEISSIREEQKEMMPTLIDARLLDFEARVSRLEERFIRETDAVKELLKKNDLDKEPLWRKFTEEVLIDAKQELEAFKFEKKDKKSAVLLKLVKRIDDALEFLAR